MYSKQMVHGTELESVHYQKAESLFTALKHHISIKGVITGCLPGKVFVSNDFATAVLTSPQGIFLGGSPENGLFLEEANKLLRERLLPALASAGKRDYVLFYPSSDPSWDRALETVTKDLLPMRSGRMTFTHDLSGIAAPNDNFIVPVDGGLLRRQHIAGLDEIVSEISGGWPSLEAFEDRGFGCAAIQDTDAGPAIISWCLTDWVVDRECEFGIQTARDYRCGGWARKTALGALSLAKQRGMTRVGWQCWSNNIGSQKTALAAGFRLLADFPVLFGWNRPFNNLLVNGNHYMRGDAKYGAAQDFARAAWSYAQALDRGWDWNGDAALYWNAACMFYKTGEMERAKRYYTIAVEKGWIDYRRPHYHEHVYREEDSGHIARILVEL